MKQFTIPIINEEKSKLKTIRIKTELLDEIINLSDKSKISVNRIVNECIKYALDNLDEESVKELEEKNKPNNENN